MTRARCSWCSAPLDGDDGLCGECLIDASAFDEATRPVLQQELRDGRWGPPPDDAPGEPDVEHHAPSSAAPLGSLIAPSVPPVPPDMDFDSLLAEHTGGMHVEVPPGGVFVPAPAAATNDVDAMCEPNAVLAWKPGVDLASMQLSPFELYILGMIDGRRPVARIRKKTRLVMSDLKVAIGILAARDLLVLKGTLEPEGDGEDDGFENTEEIFLSSQDFDLLASAPPAVPVTDGTEDPFADPVDELLEESTAPARMKTTLDALTPRASPRGPSVSHSLAWAPGAGRDQASLPTASSFVRKRP